MTQRKLKIIKYSVTENSNFYLNYTKSDTAKLNFGVIEGDIKIDGNAIKYLNET